MVISAGKRCAITPIIARRTNVRKQPLPDHFAALTGAGNPTPATMRSPVPHQEEPGCSRDPTSGCSGSMGDQSVKSGGKGMLKKCNGGRCRNPCYEYRPCRA